VSIKGTLETFNLCELLQMLAFNQKQGTLVLEGERGARVIYLDAGKLTLLEQDQQLTASVARLARRSKLGADGRFESAMQRHEESGRNLLGVMEAMGILDEANAAVIRKQAVLEQLFEAQLTAVAGFEFIEHKALRPDRSEGVPIRPLLGVEGLLLDLARMLDQWNSVSASVSGSGEVYEGTGISVDLSEEDDLDGALADEVIPLIDGYRSIAQIAETCFATPYAVTLIAAALQQAGGIRSVPTDDLMRRAEDELARGQAARALPLLARCIERGDAPLEVRLRLADALEASGDPAAAAAELDTFAALSEDDETPAVFEALHRALRLRDGDVATATRMCDYYLRRRPWLQDYRALAVEALRDLISGSATNGRPVDAALRLKGFIDCGDAPSEDLLMLADLFVAGGARKEAAAALYARAEELLTTERKPAARQLLRRVLELDPGHADAHRCQSEQAGVRRRRGHHARVVMILLLMVGIAGVAGFAWWTSRDTTSNEIRQTRAEAVASVERAEAKAETLIDTFTERARAAETSTADDEGLGAAANALLREVQQTMDSATPALTAYADEIKRSETFGYAKEHARRHEALTQRRHILKSHAKQSVDDLAPRARASLAIALKNYEKGEFKAARGQLLAAKNLAFNDATTLADAKRRLALVTDYIKRYETLRDRMLAETKAGEYQAAFVTGAAAVRELLDSDLTRKLPFPVQITSSPAGAEVWLGGKDTRLRTPCVLAYTPFAEEPTVDLRLPGHTHASTPLPSFAQILRKDGKLERWLSHISGTLQPGVRWTVSDPVSGFAGLWSSGAIPLVAGSHGRKVYAAAPEDGRLVQSTQIDAGDPIRLGGRLIGGTEWRIQGHRTLHVRPPSDEGWEVQAIGRLQRAPLSIDGRLVIVDELGTLYCFEAQSGEAQWRVELGGPPTQAPQASRLGILIATTTGASYRIDPIGGKVSPLAAGVRGPVLALPLKDGALLIGGGARGCRSVDGKGRVTTHGEALPDIGRKAWIEAAGVAWIESDGVHWMGAEATAPVRVAGLGPLVEHVSGGAGLLFGTTPDGTLRAVSLTTLQQSLWSAPLGGRAQTPALRLGHAAYLLVDGQLVAIDV